MLPHLSELAVRYRDEDFVDFHEVTPREDIIHFKQILHYYSTWNLPALRRMSTIDLIPVRFSGCTSLESLSIDMGYSSRKRGERTQRPFDAVGLASFLSSCPSLRKFSLKLTWAMTLTDGRVTERVNLTNVEELDIHLDWCCANSVQYFMNTTHFPRVTSMNFVVICQRKIINTDRHPDNNIEAVFSNPNVFPHLERLKFSAHCNFRELPVNLERTIRLPIHNLPGLKFLHLNLSGATIEPSVVDRAIPAHLSSLFLDGCWNSGSEWVVQLAHALKVRGRLDSLHLSTTHIDLVDGVRTKGIFMFS